LNERAASGIELHRVFACLPVGAGLPTGMLVGGLYVNTASVVVRAVIAEAPLPSSCCLLSCAACTVLTWLLD
jgi:hypothetical protein